jgi:hypothetical protein
MPRYRVSFERPVVYQYDSPLSRRETAMLEVHAPDGQAAIVHAIRVTRGDGGAATALLLPLGGAETAGA